MRWLRVPKAGDREAELEAIARAYRLGSGLVTDESGRRS